MDGSSEGSIHKISKAAGGILYVIGYVVFSVVAIPIALAALAAKGIRHLCVGRQQQSIHRASSDNSEEDVQDDSTDSLEPVSVYKEPEDLITRPLSELGDSSSNNQLQVSESSNSKTGEAEDLERDVVADLVDSLIKRVIEGAEDFSSEGPYPLQTREDPFFQCLADFVEQRRTQELACLIRERA